MSGTWLSERERLLVDGAEKLDLDLPVPTQIVSNGEYLPPKQSDIQKDVEKRTVELADKNAKFLGMSRREFLQTSCGMATAFMAMNEIYGGGVFKVSEAEARDPEMMLERTASLEGQFIFDDQTHFLRDDFSHEEITGLGEFAAEHWNPVLKEEGISLTRYSSRTTFANFGATLIRKCRCCRVLRLMIRRGTFCTIIKSWTRVIPSMILPVASVCLVTL